MRDLWVFYITLSIDFFADLIHILCGQNCLADPTPAADHGFPNRNIQIPFCSSLPPLLLVLPPGCCSIYFSLHANNSMANSCPLFKTSGLSHSASQEQTPHNPWTKPSSNAVLFNAPQCRPKLHPGNVLTEMSIYQHLAPFTVTAQTEPGCPKLRMSSHALYQHITTVAAIQLSMSTCNTFMSHWHIDLLGINWGFILRERTTTFPVKGII